jgi:putative endonuclease
VYILASRRNGTLYVGVTSDLARRVSEHRSGAAEGFTRNYGRPRISLRRISRDHGGWIAREKRIKKWRRAWKLELIEQHNPQWRDSTMRLIL